MSQAVHALKALLVCAEDEVRQTAGTRAAPHTIHIFLLTAFVNGLLLFYLKKQQLFFEYKKDFFRIKKNMKVVSLPNQHKHVTNKVFEQQSDLTMWCGQVMKQLCSQQ